MLVARWNLLISGQQAQTMENGKQFDADRHKVLGQQCFSSVPRSAGVFVGN
jgi:hypothetical protein